MAFVLQTYADHRGILSSFYFSRRVSSRWFAGSMAVARPKVNGKFRLDGPGNVETRHLAKQTSQTQVSVLDRSRMCLPEMGNRSSTKDGLGLQDWVEGDWFEKVGGERENAATWAKAMSLPHPKSKCEVICELLHVRLQLF